MSSCISDLDIPKKPPHKSASEHRRATKPIMEKRRRARINNSLNELKSLILDALNKDPSRHSKLEKADILEMTVRHLQNLQRQQMAMEMARDPSVLNKFRAGFTECASEVSRYVNKIDGVDGRTKQRLISHLHGCVTSISSIAVTASQAAMQNVYPAMMATGGGGRDGQQHQLQLHIPGMAGGVEGSLFPSSATTMADGAINLTTATDMNNNRQARQCLESKLSTPPPSGSSQFSFQFPPSAVHSPVSRPTTPLTPGKGLSITVTSAPYGPGPTSVSSGYHSFGLLSPSGRYQPYRREHLESVSPCSRSSLGSFSPSGSEVFSNNDVDVEHDVKREPADSGDVWRPW